MNWHRCEISHANFYFLPSCVNSLFGKMLLGMHYKNSIKEYTFEYYPYDNTNIITIFKPMAIIIYQIKSSLSTARKIF